MGHLRRPPRRLACLFLLCLSTLSTLSQATTNFVDDGFEGETDEEYDQRYAEFVTTETERGLFPSIFNLATNAMISSTATCGERGPEEYCKLVEHVLWRKTPGNGAPQCDTCDANDARRRHPVEFAIDGTRRWWQSPSLHNGLEYEKVNITIDLRQEYQVAYMVVKMGNAPRPGSWVLERSLDGENWQAWQYFATNDAECVHCTSEYSKLTPLEYGEIHISLVNGRPGAKGPSLELQKFTRTRFVRLRLIDLRTLNADLLIVNSRGHKLDKSVTMRYFYSISDISIGGQCICYGHAESCPADPVTGQFQCECRHNTCGESCNKCCPLFNQLPWKPGTNAQPNICQQCQCFSHADECVYDEDLARDQLSVTPEGVFEGGGRCLQCQHNTEGINCERCLKGYYRPSGMSHYREDACRSCDCDETGSESEECIRDDQSAINGMAPGDCRCKPGFGGRRCERCAPGYRNYPHCEPCPCNQAGSLNFDHCEHEKCQCKANVEGLYCDRCKSGTIHLSKENPQGCQPCFCFGLSTNCTEKEWATGKIQKQLGWQLTDLSGGREVAPDNENGEVLMFNANQNKDRSLYYWKAPKAYTGNLLTSYGGILHYYVYFVPTDSSETIPVADVVIEGQGIKLEHHSRIPFHPRENVTVQIALREGAGWYNSQSRRPADKADVMRALSGVSLFLVRAMYNQNQLQSSIFGLTLDKAVARTKGNALTSDTLMKSVEVCECPEGTSGNSCESCPHGYRRVDNQLFNGRCEKCDCNDHADSCDPFTGECTDCQHNTTGSRCEMCLPGHYGNPSLGGEFGSCQPCACPTLDNNYSKECALAQLVVSGSAASTQDAYVCTACEPGYEGNKCEMCADGYWGDPLEVNGTCRECECNGNIDAMAIGNCDTKTGECLKCIGHTTGEECEKCLPHHFGSALTHTCHPCGCHRQGAVSLECHEGSGVCECKDHYIGRHCDQCEEGYGDVENGCEECGCDATGSVGSECDQVSGQCTCKQGVFGKRCDQCRPSYFQFSDSGCQFCNCNTYGSIEDGKCDNVTGACQCRSWVEGQMCEKCVEGYFNISSGNGCQPCECDDTGAEGTACDLVSGQCKCKPGVTGLKCDQCAPNHWGLSDNGCKNVPSARPLVKCVMRWDYHPLKGCKKCECSKIGAAGSKCNPRNGQCECKEEFVGLKCDRCSHGFFNFPICEPCACQPEGTDPLQCREGLCLCDEQGKCPCKKNVIGAKCDQCRDGAFSLDSSNTLGCTDCFCFNRSSTCRQANLVWKQVYAEEQSAIFQEPWEFYTQKHNIRLLQEHSGTPFNSYPTDDTPLYWQLPKTFLGDRTASYNGFLRFKIWNNDNRLGVEGVRPNPKVFRYFPQVILVGNNRIELEHIPFDISDDGKYKVRMHESEWRSRQSPEVAVSRKLLMVALQNIQGVYIRASYNYPSRGDTISIAEISLDVASEDTHETGVCMDCADNTWGDRCELCLEGYVGDATRGGALACTKCACPLVDNSFSKTCVPVEYGRGYLCDSCKPGYTGQYCESCVTGYYGDPSSIGGQCIECDCHPDGSLHGSCHPLTGECECKPGVTGRDCSRCQERHAFINRKCTSCDQGCYLELMLDIDDLEETLAEQNFTNLRPIPWKRVGRIENSTALLREFVGGLAVDPSDLNILDIQGKSKYAREADAVVDEANFMGERAARAEQDILNYTTRAEGISRDAQAAFKQSFNTTQFLKHFARYGGISVGAGQVELWAAEAEAHQNATIERGRYVEKRHGRVQGAKTKTDELMKKVLQLKLNDTAFEEINQRLVDVEGLVEDFRTTVYEKAKKDGADASRMSTVVSKRIERYREVAGQIDTLRAEAEDALSNARSEVSQAREGQLLDAYDSYQKIRDSLAAAAEHANTLTNLSNSYAQLTDEYDDAYVQPSSKHAMELAKHSRRVGDAFRTTKAEAANPLKASAAYDDIVGALRNATMAVEKAQEAVTESHNLAIGSGEEEKEKGLAVLVAGSQEYSTVLSGEAASIQRIWSSEDLAAKGKALKERLSLVNEQIIDMTRRKDAIRPQLENFDDQHERMGGLQQMAVESEERAREAKEKAEGMKEEVREIGEQTDKLANSTAEGIREEIDKITLARSELSSSSDNLSRTRNEMAINGERMADVERRIALLKERIEETRERARQVPLALRADERGHCRRSYISPAAPSSANRFHVKFRPLKGVPDAVIFSTRTKGRRTQASEYVAVEVVDRRVVAHWNIGGGKKKVTNTHPINFIPHSDRAATGTWYHIDVSRTGDSVNLTVSLRESTIGEGSPFRSDPISVSAGQHSSIGDSIFNTVPGETELAFGTTKEEAKELGLASSQFKGIIGGLRVDQTPLELWAFQESTQECEGATPPPNSAPPAQHFRDGFAVINLPVSERTVASLTVAFSTYSTEGLLYFRGDEHSGDFLALYMEKGHIVFKINVGGASSAEIRSGSPYFDGQQHTVKAIRNGMEMHLQVDSDADRRSTVIPGQNTQMNIQGDAHFVAGVPPEYRTSAFAHHAIQWRGFTGCILSVKPTQVNDLNIGSPLRSLRRSAGCRLQRGHLEADGLIGFPTPGYFVTQGFEITTNSSISLTFRTREENGTLLFTSAQLPEQRQRRQARPLGYLALYLFRGYIVAHFGLDPVMRESAVTIRSPLAYNDGNAHSLFLVRDGDNLRMRIDDREVGVATLADEAPVGGTSLPLYIGGFPPGIEPPSAEIPTAVSLIGCISDLTHNFNRHPIVPRHQKALLGACSLQQPHLLIDHTIDIDPPASDRKQSPIQIDPEIGPIEVMRDDAKPLPVDRDTCTLIPSGQRSEGAARFGVAKSSHSRINFDKDSTPDIHSFSLQFEVRTDASEGLLWTWANYKNYTRYFLLTVEQGYLTFHIKGHREPRRAIFSDRRLDDDQWHSIRLVKTERDVLIEVDEGLSPLRITECPHPKVMRRRMYIGGVISAHRHFGLSLPPSLPGCIRQFTVDDRSYPLLTDTSRDVIPCSLSHSKGAYVHSEGFAVFEPLSKIRWEGTVPWIEMEVRPITQNGTLLALMANSNPRDRMALEWNEGMMQISVLHGESGMEVRDVLPTIRPLCDGEWHTIRIDLHPQHLGVTIDRESHTVPVPFTSTTRQFFTKLPLNIAGVNAIAAKESGLSPSLTGCYRELTINGKALYFEQALKATKVIIDGCPFA
ncbi:unnamed protein product, partial [Mesorhabditis spiculigera]